MPKLAESNHSHSFLIMMMKLPLALGVDFFPKLTGIVRSSTPSRVTVICLLVLSATRMVFGPTEALMDRSAAPYRLPPSGRPPMAARTEILVPGCQYSLVRKCTSLSFHQYQTPS